MERFRLAHRKWRNGSHFAGGRALIRRSDGRAVWAGEGPPRRLGDAPPAGRVISYGAF